MTSLAELTHEYFEQRIGQAFQVSADETSLELRIVNVVMLPPPRRKTLSGHTIEVAATRLPFSIYLRSEGEMGLRQGTYNLRPSDGSQALDIFLVPLGFEDGGVVYEAIFS